MTSTQTGWDQLADPHTISRSLTQELGLDFKQFDADLAGPDVEARVSRARKERGVWSIWRSEAVATTDPRKEVVRIARQANPGPKIKDEVIRDEIVHTHVKKDD